MDYAYRKGDAARAPVDGVRWQQMYKATKPEPVPCCLVCNADVHLKAENSPDTETHFSHYPHAACPTMAGAHVPYQALTALAQNPGAASALQSWAYQNLSTLHWRTGRVVQGMTWDEFIGLLESAKKLNIWSIRDLDPGYLPYVFACCVSSFPVTRFRNKETFFVLDSAASQNVYWNKSVSIAQVIWKVEVSKGSRKLTALTMKPESTPAWFVSKAKSVLGQ